MSDKYGIIYIKIVEFTTLGAITKYSTLTTTKKLRQEEEKIIEGINKHTVQIELDNYGNLI